ncbi:MAG: hypothetical protein ACRELE_07405 [Gemmatimonadales bacterium]
MVVGDSEAIRATTLDKIAKAHETSMDWLMSGRGPDPLKNDPVPYVEYTDFEQLVDSLTLSPLVRAAVLDLPKATSHAHTVLCDWGMMAPNRPEYQPYDVLHASSNANYNASAYQYVSWAHLFDGMIKAYGKDRVREKLESELDRIRMGFHAFPLEMVWLEETRPILATVAARFEQRQRMSIAFYDVPPVPPLDALPPEAPKKGRPAKSGTGKRGRT